ncbi:MAG: hypothetical protein AAB451_03455 [Patescibacteria group bacterium]
MPEFLNKKTLITSLIVLPLFVLAGLGFYFLNQEQIETGIIPSEKEKITNQQLKELDELKQRADNQPLTAEQKKVQVKDLEILRQQSGIKPLSQSEIQKQLEELDKLRLAQ